MWRQIGPYHAARLAAAARALAARGAQLAALEIAGTEQGYAWDAVGASDAYSRHTLFPGRDYATLAAARVRRAVRGALDEMRPDVVAVNGWAFPESHAAIAWCRRHHRPLVVMAEMNSWPSRRHAFREALKRRLVGQCDAALVGGTRHHAYLVHLGLPADAVFRGYDVVDNAYFAEAVERCRAARREAARPYLLSVQRFVWQKNLRNALRAYAAYVRTVGPAAWDWVLCGDGPLRDEFVAARRAYGLEARVRLTGFVQVDQLPPYYADAGALWLPSISETWGLVINEAMAAGLPVLVSERAGCAEDLVEPGGNGWTFEPTAIAGMTDVLLRLHGCDATRRAAMGRRSQAIIANWEPQRFGTGLWSAIEAAVSRCARRRRAALSDRILLWMLDR